MLIEYYEQELVGTNRDRRVKYVHLIKKLNKEILSKKEDKLE